MLNKHIKANPEFNGFLKVFISVEILGAFFVKKILKS